MENLFELNPAFLVAIPLIVALVQLVKNLGLASKFAPILSIVFGIGLVALTGATWQADLVGGILLGLTASGLYSGKSVVE